MNTKTPKTKQIKVLQGNYGYGWDDLVTYELDDNSIRDDIQAYRNNQPGLYRIIHRRVLRD